MRGCSCDTLLTSDCCWIAFRKTKTVKRKQSDSITSQCCSNITAIISHWSCISSVRHEAVMNGGPFQVSTYISIQLSSNNTLNQIQILGHKVCIFGTMLYTQCLDDLLCDQVSSNASYWKQENKRKQDMATVSSISAEGSMWTASFRKLFGKML